MKEIRDRTKASVGYFRLNNRKKPKPKKTEKIKNSSVGYFRLNNRKKPKPKKPKKIFGYFFGFGYFFEMFKNQIKNQYFGKN